MPAVSGIWSSPITGCPASIRSARSTCCAGPVSTSRSSSCRARSPRRRPRRSCGSARTTSSTSRSPRASCPVIERELRQAKLRRAKEDAEETLRHLTYIDSLTGLPNGRMLVENVDRHLHQRAPGAPPAMLIVLNLDRFRRINESLGQNAGDRVLQEVARRLTASVADRGEVARLSQDKFAVYLRSVAARDDAHACRRVGGERVRAAVRRRRRRDVHHLHRRLQPVSRTTRPIPRACCSARKARCSRPAGGTGTLDALRRRSGASPRAAAAPRECAAHAVQHGELFLLYQPQIDLAQRQGRVLGSAGALEASAARHADAGQVHSARRRDRADPGGRKLGARRGDAADATLGRRAAAKAPIVAVNVSADAVPAPDASRPRSPTRCRTPGSMRRSSASRSPRPC